MNKPEKLPMRTPDIADDKFTALAEMFPGAVTETIDENGMVVRAIDADILAQEINTHVVSGKEERYQFTWPDKKKSILLANAPIAAALRPCREESVDFDNTENLYIEGDNLDVLKLLRETYLNRVKMIYIDPPYNTGKDFIYEDDFVEETSEFLYRDGQYDEQGNRMVENFESNGRFHTDWLNMMYPRLRVARDLLAEDGVIFISIDDNELGNLLKLTEEVFGASNHIATFSWIKKKKGSHLSKTVRSMTEYVLVFGKNICEIELYGEDAYNDKWQPLAKRTNAHKTLTFEKNIVETTLDNGIYSKGSYGAGSSALNFLNDFIVLNKFVTSSFSVSGPFVWTQAKLDDELSAGSRIALSSKFGFNVLRSDQAEKIKRPPTILDNKLGIGTNEDAYAEIIELFNQEGIMEYPKPVSLIKYLVRTLGYYDKEMTVLDFFSGSATTAHAVMQLNAEDGGKRKFIMVQLPELTDRKSEAYKAGYKNICEIGKERIRRAGAKIKEEIGLTVQGLDIGFRVLKLDSSNMKKVNNTPEEYEQINFDIDDFMDNIKPGRSGEDLLFQVMLDLGIPLSAKIEQKGRAFYVNDNYLIAYFDKADTDIITEIAKKRPYYAVFRDSSFKSDSALVNFEQVFNTYSPNTIRRVL